MANSAYQYDALPPGNWFRLLQIYPGHRNDPLHCALTTTALEEAPDYKALSYVWGDPTNTGHVTCSGVKRSVTLSLLGGLRQLRNSEHVEVVWADAICINQSDLKEKSHQVNLMGTIYDQADEVVVWLGDDPADLAEDAFEGILNVNQAIRNGTQRTWHLSEEWGGSWGSGQETSVRPLSVSRDNLPSILKAEHLRAIKQLYQLAWFTRVWVLQEVGLATRATTCWGDRRIDFSEIAMFVWSSMNDLDLERTMGQEIKAIISGCPYNALWSVWSTYDKKNSWVQTSPQLKYWADHLAAECNIDFVLVLEASRAFNATDLRDHVFAFLGHPKALIPGTKQLIVKADYELNLEQLHRSVAENLVKISLNCLVQVQNTTESLERSNEDPSWVPRWDSSNDDAPTAFWEAWDTSLRVSRQYAPPVQVCGNKLIVSAFIFDTVHYQTNVMSKSDLDRFSGKIGSLIEEFWDLTERAAQTVQHKYHDNAVLALASVLTCSHAPKLKDPEHDTKLIGGFSQTCAHFNGKFHDEKLLKFKHAYPWTVMQYRAFSSTFQHYGTNRRFLVTKGGYWGLGPSTMQEGDVCAVLLGGDVPFVLRPAAEKGTFRLVGQLYVYGAMYGEIVHESETAGIKSEEICIM